MSPPTKFEAKDAKATKRPLAEIEGKALSSFPSAPAEPTLTRVVSPRTRSRTKTSYLKFRSPSTRLGALSEKATKRPVAEIEIGKFEEAPDVGFPSAPAELTLTRVVFTATPAEAGTVASAKAETVSAINRCLDRLILSFPSPPSWWRMQAEHTPAWVGTSRVAGFRVIGFKPGGRVGRPVWPLLVGPTSAELRTTVAPSHGPTPRATMPGTEEQAFFSVSVRVSAKRGFCG